MDRKLYKDLLGIGATSAHGSEFADFLEKRLQSPACKVGRFTSGTGESALFFSWGEPRIVFCTRLDTAMPYPGQISTMYEACLELEHQGKTGFGLLLPAAADNGVCSIQAFLEAHPAVEYLLAGAPTDNCMAAASKGKRSYRLRFIGNPCPSTCPEQGHSAVDMFLSFTDALRSIGFPEDPLTGLTTWSISQLESDGNCDQLSSALHCELCFRTTESSDAIVMNIMNNISGAQARLRFGRKKAQDGSDLAAKEIAGWQLHMEVNPSASFAPMEYLTLPGIAADVAATGSEVSGLEKFAGRILYGPGNIRNLKAGNEFLESSEINEAISNYVKIYDTLMAQAVSTK